VYGVLPTPDKVYIADFDCGLSILGYSTSAVADEMVAEPRLQIYPVPVGNFMQINLELEHRADLALVIYDGLGHMVWSGSFSSVQPGPFSFNWNSQDSSGRLFPSGPYQISVFLSGRLKESSGFVISR
jgi:hypothetical protein